MIKPLLRTIPTLSGNVKLACTLLDYNKIGKDTFETNIRGAHIYPLSSQLFQKSVQANLLSSSWEYDLKTFYNTYSDTFFESCFNYSDTEMPLLDKSRKINARNTDFEYGVKRISYIKSGNQYACFAPIYIDNVKDIPSYFLIDVKLESVKYSTIKHIKVNIGNNGDKNNNFIYKYISKYLSKIDDNVAFMNNGDKTVVYYGIDVINGGFTKRIDSTVQSLFDIQLPMQLFDFTLSEGFKRNRLCMRQCLPLCFYFNIESILTPMEKNRYDFAKITFSSAYYDSVGNKLPWYDFDWDYDEYTQQIYTMNKNNGKMEFKNGFSENILDLGFPAFNDRYITNYQFANKLTTTFGRWKLKYSTDNDPYITNMSWAFSINQNSNYKYKNYPAAFTNQAGYAVIDKYLRYNLVLPIGQDASIYNDINAASTKKYDSIMNNSCLSWFDVVKENITKDNIETLDINWANVNNGYVYFNGVLYNLNNIYNSLNTEDIVKIDKFAICVRPIVDNIYKKEELNNLIFSTYNIIPKDLITDKALLPNCVFNINSLKNDDNIYNILSSDYTDILQYNNIFKEADETEELDQFYINIFDVRKDASGNREGIHYQNLNIIRSILDYDEITGIALDTNISLASFKSNVKSLLGIDLINEFDNDVIENALESLWVAKNNSVLPSVFKYNHGITLYKQLPIYRGNQYILDDGKINKKLQGLYLNTGLNNFNPKLITDESYLDTLENAGTTYYYMLYDRNNFVNTAYYKNVLPENVDKGVMYEFCTSIDNIIRGYNISDVYNMPESKSAKLYNCVNFIYNRIKEKCIELILNNSYAAEYEFSPIINYNGDILAENIIKQRGNNFKYVDKFIKDINNDNNVIYLHPYNIDKICQTANIDKALLKTATLYGKMLNKAHLLKMMSLSNSTSTFYKQYKVFTKDSSNKTYNNVKYLYKQITNSGAANIRFSNEKQMFYEVDNYGEPLYINNDKTNKNNIIYFNICERTNFYKITPEIIDFINLDKNTKNFNDLFIYRPLTDIEYDEKSNGISKTLFYDDIVNKVGSGILENTDTVLYHCFNDYLVQNKDNSMFFYNWCTDNITPVITVDNKTYYRYNADTLSMLILVSTEWAEKNGINLENVKRYKKITPDNPVTFNITNKIKTLTSAASLKNNRTLNIVEKNNCIYGYYLLDVDINNTHNIFNIRGVLDSDLNSYNIFEIAEINKLRFITAINGIDITYNKEYIQNIFVQLCPFMTIDLISYIRDINIIVNAHVFNLTNSYTTALLDNSNKSKERSLLFVKNNIMSAKKNILQRYTDSIIPHIKETSRIKNLYFLKHKNVNDTLIETGKFNSIGDSVIYKTDVLINNPKPFNIYTISANEDIKSYNNVVETYLPLEYKFYDNSVVLNLPLEISVKLNKILTYSEILKHQTNTRVLDIFTQYITNKLNINKDEILFLFNQYNVSFNTEVIGVSLNNTEKTYKLTYKFNLL